MSDLMLSTVKMLAHKPAPKSDARAGGAAPDQQEVKPSQQAEEIVSKVAVKGAAEQIDSYLKSSGRNLEFQVDEESGEVVVRVRDAATGDVIRQIPGDEVLRLARALQENASVLVDLTV
jgi:flagellar protein FlaG